MIREILTQAARWVGAMFTQSADATFRERWRLYFLLGHAAEGRVLHRKRPVNKKRQMLVSNMS